MPSPALPRGIICRRSVGGMAMCGRASQYSEFSEVEKRFRLMPGRRPPDYLPHWNAVPRMNLLVARIS